MAAAAGAHLRSAKHAILFGGTFTVAGSLADYGLRQTMGTPYSKEELHSSVDYKRFDAKE